jgi:hypothetical protein
LNGIARRLCTSTNAQDAVHTAPRAISMTKTTCGLGPLVRSYLAESRN